MSTIKLIVESDLSQVDNAFINSQNAIKGVNKEVQSTANTVKGSFANASEGTKKINAEINNTKTSVSGLSKELDKVPVAVDKTTIATKSLRTQLKDLKAELANATDPKDIERLSKAAGALADQIGDAADAAAVFATDSPFEAVGNAIGSVGSKLMNLDFKGAADQSKLLVAATKQITFKETIGSIKQIGTTLLNVGKSLLKNPLFLIGAAVTLIISNFDKLKNSGGLVGTVFKSIGKAITIVIDAGKDFLDLIGLIDSTKKSMEELIKSNEQMAEQIGARYDYEIAKAKQAKKATEQLEIDKAKAQIRSVQEQLRITKAAYDDGEIDTKDYYDKVLEIGKKNGTAIIGLINAQTAAEKKADDDKKKLQDDRKKKNDEYAADQKKKAEDLASALLDIQKRYEAAQIELATDEDKILLEKQFADKELALLRQQLIKKNEAAGKGKKLSIEQEVQFQLISLSIQDSATNKIIALETEKAKKVAEIQKKQLEDEVSFQERKTRLQILAIENQKAPQGFDEVEFERQKQIKILEIRKQAAIDALAIKIKVKNADKELLVAETEEVVNEIDKQIDGLKKKNKGSLGELLGISNTDELIKSIEAVDKLIANLGKLLSVSADKAIAENQRKIDSSKSFQSELQKEKDALIGKLTDEQKLRDDGFANDTDRINAEIARKDAEIAAEKKREAELLEERKQALKTKLAIDSATQISNIVTAGSTLFAKEAFKGVPGIITASATIIGMIASMLALRQQIKAQTEGFAEGGYTGDGGKYSEAGVVHRGEYVITKEKTAKNRALLDGLHTDNPALIKKGIFELLQNTGVSLPDSRNLSNKRAYLSDALSNKANASALNLSNVERELSEIKAKFDQVLKGQEKESYTRPDGAFVKKVGSHSDIIRKS